MSRNKPNEQLNILDEDEPVGEVYGVRPEAGKRTVDDALFSFTVRWPKDFELRVRRGMKARGYVRKSDFLRDAMREYLDRKGVT